jgi:hypothetical protein
MYTLEQIKEGIRRGVADPSFFAEEINRLYYTRAYSRSYNTAGVDVMARDWDLLVLLDACRYDQFVDTDYPDGTLHTETSRGSHTREWLRGNFGDRECYDTVYVTASPQLYRWNHRINADFHSIDNVWQTHTDERWGVVMADVMADQIRHAAKEHPHKRIIGHFMQPHYPFIGPGTHLNSRDEDDPDIWNRIRTGDLETTPQEVDDALRANLERALPSVRSLVDDFAGRTVISADHGNMLGERVTGPVPYKAWGHPPGTYTPPLVTVPWLEIEATGTRRRISSEAPVRTSARTNDGSVAVKERLQDLGYA